MPWFKIILSVKNTKCSTKEAAYEGCHPSGFFSSKNMTVLIGKNLTFHEI